MHMPFSSLRSVWSAIRKFRLMIGMYLREMEWSRSHLNHPRDGWTFRISRPMTMR
jgi:hypothetical protein